MQESATNFFYDSLCIQLQIFINLSFKYITYFYLCAFGSLLTYSSTILSGKKKEKRKTIAFTTACTSNLVT